MTQEQIKQAEQTLAELATAIDKAKAELAAVEKVAVAGSGRKRWRARPGEKYIVASVVIGRNTEAGDKSDEFLYVTGNYFPDTDEGRAAAEVYKKKMLFRQRWIDSADVGPNRDGFLPLVSPDGGFVIDFHYTNYGLPKWSTREACQAFVDSEGGPEKFREKLERGIL